MITCKIFETKINYDSLDECIKKYITSQKSDFQKMPSYLVMNEKTQYQMWKDSVPQECWNPKGTSYSSYGYHGVYHGIPIAICEKLEDGMVDIV